MDYRTEAPEIIRSFLNYHENIVGRSPRNTDLETISISDIDLDFVRSVTLSDVYDYLGYMSRDRVKNQNASEPEYGLNSASRARKVSTIRSFYKYLTLKTHQLEANPIQDLDSPKIMKSLPRYLSLSESQRLLDCVDGKNKERDYCILTIFLNCGLRISELVGLNLTDVRADHLRVLGKGNKERVVYINDAVAEAINDYLKVRKTVAPLSERALFLSSRRERISKSTVHALVKKHLGEAGLDETKYSAHKLRHTAATLMLHSGVDVRTLQELLGHEHLNTTEIYTHVENAGLREAAQLSPLAGHKKPAARERDGQEDEEE